MECVCVSYHSGYIPLAVHGVGDFQYDGEGSESINAQAVCSGQ